MSFSDREVLRWVASYCEAFENGKGVHYHALKVIGRQVGQYLDEVEPSEELPYLPAAPFHQWLEQRCKELSPANVAAAIGVSRDAIYQRLNKNGKSRASVHWATVDRYTKPLGWRVEDIYPDE
jgi:hypothetical protein